MTSKAIILGVGLPMVIFGAFIALVIAPMAEGVESTIEFVGSLIGLETKAKFLHSEAIGSNAALYYVEKALSIIKDVRNSLTDSEGIISSKIKLIDQLLSKAEKIVQEST